MLSSLVRKFELRLRSRGTRWLTLSIGKIKIDGEEYTVNGEFKDIILALADETELNEIEVAKILLSAQDDVSLINRPLLQRGLIQFHQHRKFALDTLRLLLELDRLSEEERSETLEDIKMIVEKELLAAPSGSTKRSAEQCIDAMSYTKALLKKVGDKLTAASMLGQDRLGQLSDEMETMEFVRVSLYQQHEVLGLVLSRIFEKGLANQQDFKSLLDILRRADRYDALLSMYWSLCAPSSRANFAQYMSFLPSLRSLPPARLMVTGQSCDQPWKLIIYSHHVRII